MNLFAYFYHSRPVKNMSEKILELSDVEFMNLEPYGFDVDHVAKIRSELSITVLEKK